MLAPADTRTARQRTSCMAPRPRPGALPTAFGNALGSSIAELAVGPTDEEKRQKVQSDFRRGEIQEQNAEQKLLDAKVSSDLSNQYARQFAQLYYDPNNPLEFGRATGSKLVDPQFRARPTDPEQAAVYDRVGGLPDKNQIDAWFAAKDVAYRQQIDALGDRIAAMSAAHSPEAAALRAEHRIGVLALLNRESYFDTKIPELLPLGWDRVEDAAGLARANLTSELLIDRKQGYFAVLYQNLKEDTYVYANRGTDDAVDWAHNFIQAVGEKSAQYEQAVNNAGRIAKSEISGHVTFTGHSLGGGLASAQSFATGIAGVTFNAAGLSPNTVGALGAERMRNETGLVKAYYVKDELLSTSQDTGKLWLAGGLLLANHPGVAARVTSLPMAAGERIALDAVSNPTLVRAGGWMPGLVFTTDNPTTMLELHGMTYVLNSVMKRLSDR